MSRKDKKKTPAVVSVPFDALVLAHGEIGVHRGRKHGFRDVFGFRTLQDLPFVRLAAKVKAAYEGVDVPDHRGWPKQREALQWFVDKGSAGMYELKDRIRVYEHSRARYYLSEGNHRALALYILGTDGVTASVVPRPFRALPLGSRRVVEAGRTQQTTGLRRFPR